NILLQVLDDGRLTDNKGRTVDFRNTNIIMTSNLGSGIITERFGSELSGSGELSEMVVENTRDEVMELMKRTLKPEFLNRIDEVVMFTPLTRRQTLQIVDIQLAAVERMLREVGMELKVTPAAREWLADAGYDPTYGARPVKRAIQTHLVNALSRSILAGSVERDRPIEVDVEGGNLIMKNA
ncbi:MAG: AAA family ATPase, partial [Rikenellaceae bacterium]|nr:AAA family ATPase [Rikenellaceae bacterium]